MSSYYVPGYYVPGYYVPGYCMPAEQARATGYGAWYAARTSTDATQEAIVRVVSVFQKQLNL